MTRPAIGGFMQERPRNERLFQDTGYNAVTPTIQAGSRQFAPVDQDEGGAPAVSLYSRTPFSSIVCAW